MKRKYNALYRLRKKGFKVISRAKTIITPPIFQEQSEMRILITEFHFVIQLELF